MAFTTAAPADTKDRIQIIKPVDQNLNLDTLRFAGEAKMIYHNEDRYEAFTDIIEFKGTYNHNNNEGDDDLDD